MIYLSIPGVPFYQQFKDLVHICEQYDHNIAEVHSKKDKEAVINERMENGYKTDPFLGGFYDTRKRSWVWNKNGDHFDFQKFSNGNRPEHGPDMKKRCMRLSVSGWYAAECQIEKPWVICELRMASGLLVAQLRQSQVAQEPKKDIGLGFIFKEARSSHDLSDF